MKKEESLKSPDQGYQIQLNFGRKSFIRVWSKNVEVVKEGVRELIKFQQSKEVQDFLIKKSA